MKQLILASTSRWRRELLEGVQVDFEVEASDYEEDMTLDMSPADLAVHLSKGKAEAVAKHHKNAVILGADSFVFFEGQKLGKPHTPGRAKEMLTMLSGKEHTFVTGFTIIDADTGQTYSEAVESKVTMRRLGPEEIDSYLTKENVLKNAGSYIVQKTGAILIERIEGSYTNVTGLPLAEVAEALKKFDINLL